MGDVVGRLFREFAITLAVTIVISAVVSLTLVPTLSARWLKPHERDRGHAPSAARTQAIFDDVIDRYDAALDWVLDRQTATLLVALAHPGADRRCSTSSSPRACSRPRTPACVQGVTEAGQSVSYAAHGRAAAAGGRGAAQGPRRREPDQPTSASTAPTPPLNTGRMLINLKPLRPAHRHRRPTILERPARARARRRRHARSTCSRCRT